MARLGYPTTEASMADRLTRLGNHPDYETFAAKINGTVLGLGGCTWDTPWKRISPAAV
jgi:hypothetical protein